MCVKTPWSPITLRIFLLDEKFMFIVMNAVIYLVLTSLSLCEYKLYNLGERWCRNIIWTLLCHWSCFTKHLYPNIDKHNKTKLAGPKGRIEVCIKYLQSVWTIMWKKMTHIHFLLCQCSSMHLFKARSNPHFFWFWRGSHQLVFHATNVGKEVN